MQAAKITRASCGFRMDSGRMQNRALNIRVQLVHEVPGSDSRFSKLALSHWSGAARGRYMGPVVRSGASALLQRSGRASRKLIARRRGGLLGIEQVIRQRGPCVNKARDQGTALIRALSQLKGLAWCWLEEPCAPGRRHSLRPNGWYIWQNQP